MVKNSQKLVISFFILLLLLFSSGCATVALTPDNLDTAAKEFTPPSGKSNLYITRTSSLGEQFYLEFI